MNYGAHPEKFPMSDRVLLEMLKDGQESALKEIFNRYNLKLFRLAIGVLKSEDNAKDLVQEVFIDLWSRRTSSNIENLPNYLSRAIKFQVLKHIRNGKIRDHHLQLMENIQFANQTEETLNFQEIESKLAKAVDELPPRCKEVFILSRIKHLSHKEISSKLNISTKTVEAQIGKALAFLRSKLHQIIVIALVGIHC